MRRICDNKRSWKLKKFNGIVLSGYEGVGLKYETEYNRYKYRVDYPHKEKWQEIDNFKFEACVKITGASRGQSSALLLFEDIDGEHCYEASLSALASILQAVQAGDIKEHDGALCGTWTFRKMGTTISLWPVEDLTRKEYAKV